MKTITVNLLDDKAIDLLKDLEALNIIRIQDDEETVYSTLTNSFTRYKGQITEHSIKEIDSKINELREGWD